MKKFEEEVKGKAETMATQPSCSMTRKVWYKADDIHELSEGWVSPEEHQQVAKALVNTIDKLDCAEERVGWLEKTVDQLKSQLEKQQPEIPEVPAYVAKLIEERGAPEDGEFKNYIVAGDEHNKAKAIDWIDKHQRTWLIALLIGYAVVKEKRFYLKHKSVLILDPDSDDSDVDELYLGAGGNFVPYQHLAYKFTQQEIDSMETGSYEIIEVDK